MIPHGKAIMGFRADMGNPLCFETVFKYMIGLLKGLVHVTKIVAGVGGDVTLNSLMDDRCTLLHRLFGVKYGGQGLIVHLDEFHGLKERIRIHGCHRRHRVTHIADLFCLERCLVHV